LHLAAFGDANTVLVGNRWPKIIRLALFRVRRANDIVGLACSHLTLVVYAYRRRGNSITDLSGLEETGIGRGGELLARNRLRQRTGHQASMWLA
jgi:hypothetical protein